MKNKIKNITISGLRGIQGTLELPLEGKSILIYGDNGTGKSSISDALEWFFNNEVRHLSSTEINLKEALINSSITEIENSSVSINFSKSAIDSSKAFESKKSKIVTVFSNETEDFQSFLSQAQKENLILRHQYLTEFVDKTKGDKLKSLSDVIGFSEVNKSKDILRKAYHSLKTEIKSQNYEAQISTQKQIQIDKIGAAIGVESNLVEKVNEILNPLKLDVKVESLKDIDTVLNILKQPSNTKLQNELRFLENCKETITVLKSEIGFLGTEYSKYYTEFNIIAKDVKSIMKVFLGELLESGKKVLDKKYHLDETCPLCLQPKSKDKLLEEIHIRLKQIEESSKKKIAYDSTKKTVIEISTERQRRLESLRIDKNFNESSFQSIKNAIEALLKKISKYIENGNIKVTSGKELSKPDDLSLSETDFEILSEIGTRIGAIQEIFKKDNKAEIYANISSAKDAFIRIGKFEREKSILENQRASMELIYNEFVSKQKEGLENFISAFSGTINEFYQFMNPDEQFQKLRIITIGEEDELNGITIEYEYNGNWVSPPQKYFSESHLNCFGLSFFLASVLAFNKENGFLLLDDIISSFDTNHRKRFADLLFERLSNFQVILMTHESEWFQYVSQLAKRKNWLIREIKWSDSEGTHLDAEPVELRDKIEKELSKGNVDLLGNPMRIYLEYALKQICANLNVKVEFRFNDVNEKRMSDELLSELKSKIKKSSTELYGQEQIINRITNSGILANLLSHNNPFSAKLGDLKAFWADFIEMEELFYCQEPNCKKPVVVKLYDPVSKRIRCRCGNKSYDWKM